MRTALDAAEHYVRTMRTRYRITYSEKEKHDYTVQDIPIPIIDGYIIYLTKHS